MLQVMLQLKALGSSTLLSGFSGTSLQSLAPSIFWFPFHPKFTEWFFYALHQLSTSQLQILNVLQLRKNMSLVIVYKDILQKYLHEIAPLALNS